MKNIWKPVKRRPKRKIDVSARQEREKAEILCGLVFILTDLRRQLDKEK